MRVAIICSEVDDASKNIARHLLKRVPWIRGTEVPAEWTYGNFQLVMVEGKLVDQEALDQSLSTDLLIFASRHQSETRKEPVFTAHFTGDVSRLTRDGSNGVLARPAPRALKLIVETLTNLSNVKVLVEATHHGPSAIETPSLFVEIGSTKAEWNNEALGDTVARALLGLESRSLDVPCPTAVGFGGPHYAVRHTDVLLRSDICFGHIFAAYQLEGLTREIIREAFEKSLAQFAYFDRKHMGGDRTQIESTVHSLGFEVLRLTDIQGRRDLSWRSYLQLKHALRARGLLAQTETVNVSASLRDALNAQMPPEDRIELTPLALNPSIVKRAQAVDEEGLLKQFEIEKIVYLERKDGSISAILVPLERDAQKIQDEMLSACIEILKKRYQIEYSQPKSKLYISERKFNPRLARSLGVIEGPLYAKLARGESIRIDDRIIKPEDVFTKVRKAINVAMPTHAVDSNVFRRP
jgi:D-aminoacyl-tRNA deacylase